MSNPVRGQDRPESGRSPVILPFRVSVKEHDFCRSSTRLTSRAQRHGPAVAPSATAAAARPPADNQTLLRPSPRGRWRCRRSCSSCWSSLVRGCVDNRQRDRPCKDYNRDVTTLDRRTPRSGVATPLFDCAGAAPRRRERDAGHGDDQPAARRRRGDRSPGRGGSTRRTQMAGAQRNLELLLSLRDDGVENDRRQNPARRSATSAAAGNGGRRDRRPDAGVQRLRRDLLAARRAAIVKGALEDDGHRRRPTAARPASRCWRTPTSCPNIGWMDPANVARAARRQQRRARPTAARPRRACTAISSTPSASAARRCDPSTPATLPADAAADVRRHLHQRRRERRAERQSRRRDLRRRRQQTDHGAPRSCPRPRPASRRPPTSSSPRGRRPAAPRTIRVTIEPVPGEEDARQQLARRTPRCSSEAARMDELTSTTGIVAIAGWRASALVALIVAVVLAVALRRVRARPARAAGRGRHDDRPRRARRRARAGVPRAARVRRGRGRAAARTDGRRRAAARRRDRLPRARALRRLRRDVRPPVDLDRAARRAPQTASCCPRSSTATQARLYAKQVARRRRRAASCRPRRRRPCGSPLAGRAR